MRTSLIILLSLPLGASAGAHAERVSIEKVTKAYNEVAAGIASWNHTRTDLAMHLVCLRVAGCADVDYPMLMVASGYATSFAYHPKKYFVMYQPPDAPEKTWERIARATGYGCEWLPKAGSAEEAWKVVHESIAAGRPVQGRWLDDLVFAGCEDAPEPAGRRVYVLGGWDEPGWWNWQRFSEWAKEFGRLGRVTGEVRRAPARERTLEILRGTVQWSEHDGRASVPWMAEGKFGFAGIEAYAADVADLGKKPDDFDSGWLGCHCIYRQITGRKHAAAYLERAAKEFPGAAGEPLRAAAREYAAAWSAWQEYGKHLGQAADLQQAKQVWENPENRRAGAAAIRQALVHERAAVAAVSRALDKAQ